MSNHRFSTISEVSELLRQKQVSPVDLVNESLQAIEQHNPKLNAFITVTAEQALAEARQAEQEINSGKWRGPLHGIPVGVKDFFDTAGIKTTAAFEHFRNRVPTKDAEVVIRFRTAGAIMVGKLNMHELGMGTTSHLSYFGAVHNPWQLEYCAGGSSGGSSAAVAAGLCFATVDTDAIGSCRLPAAICGVTGFKGTYGLISNQGVLEGEDGADELILHLAHAAFQCRSVGDAAVLLNALSDPHNSKGEFKQDYRAALESSKAIKLGAVSNYQATPQVQRVFNEAVEVFHTLGYTSTQIEAPLSPPFSIKSIEEDRNNISQSLFKEVDALILPTTSDATPTLQQAQIGGPQSVAPDNTYFANYYGLPAISIPSGFDEAGLPLGLQIVGPTWGEATVLQLAHTFQQKTKWHQAHP